MQNYFSFESLKTRTVQNKFNIIIGLIILILLFSLGNFWFSMKIMSGIRAYVGGEGLWSKAQKEAVNNLIKYSSSHNESDYNNYQNFIRVQAGDKQARLELDKPHPDLNIARQSLIQGGNNPGDVNDMIFLYRQFRHVSYISSAIQTWTQADREIANLRSTGNQIHSLVTAPLPTGNTQTQAARAARLSSLVDQTYATDSRLTVLENRFSATLGDGSRNIANILREITLLITVLLGALALTVAILIGRAIVRLDKLKTEFVSLASHQLRTPLTSINWYAEALLSEPKNTLNEEQTKYLNELYGGSRRMATLVNDLLKVSNLDLGTYTPEVRVVNIGDTLNNIIKDLQLEVDQKNLSLTTSIDTSLPKLNLDAQLLDVIFQNLISNSVRYTQQGGQIHIVVENKKPHILIRITDDGIGIPKAEQSQVFTKLFRAENAKQLSSSGTGLGLYIVKAMVQRMGGTVWFDSAENEGATFYVKLPLYGGRRGRRAKRNRQNG